MSEPTEIQRQLEDMRKAHQADVVAEEQLSLLDPVTPEEMIEAREELGPEAGRITVLRHARERRRGRPPGARNKRTDDLARYLLQFGEDPLVGAVRLASTEPEVLIEASQQEKVHSFRKDGTANMVIERMTYAEALSLISRARELAAPYIHGKQPVQVDLNIRGVDVIEEAPRQITSEAIDGDYVEVARPGEAGSAAG